MQIAEYKQQDLHGRNKEEVRTPGVNCAFIVFILPKTKPSVQGWWKQNL